MATLAPDAIHGEFVRLAHAGLAIHEYARAAVRVLRRVVAFDAVAAVWFDPTAALPVDRWIDDSMIDDAGLHLAEIELDATDIDKFRELGASGRRAARLSEATDGRGRSRAAAAAWGGRRAPGRGLRRLRPAGRVRAVSPTGSSPLHGPRRERARLARSVSVRRRSA